jgi:hypothetical protein
MVTDTITALRALAQHLERNKLDDGSIMRAAVVDAGRLDVQIYADPDVDMSVLVARWADTIDGATVTAKPVESSFHVTVDGRIGAFPVTLVCVASGTRADRIRAALGLAALPTLATGDALLAALAPQAAVA